MNSNGNVLYERASYFNFSTHNPFKLTAKSQLDELCPFVLFSDKVFLPSILELIPFAFLFSDRVVLFF
jgi:hypothetical protein